MQDLILCPGVLERLIDAVYYWRGTEVLGTKAMSPVDPPSLELHCLGAPTALLDGQSAPQVVTWRKHLALLVYLALTPDRTRTRRHLVGLLWPEKDEAKARRSLNQAITLLRAELGTERLTSHGESLTLLDANLRVDVLELDRLVQQRSADAALLAPGDFLEGFVLEDAPAFEEWAANERQRVRVLVRAALVAAGEEALAAVRYVEAISLARRALGVDPFGEPAQRLLMRATALSGDIAGALVAYNEFAERMTTELGAQPSRDLIDLSERVRSMRWRRFTPVKIEEEPPLVGREDVRKEAFTLLETGIRYGPCTLLITGDPGTGRTRFLVECAEQLALEGSVIVPSRPLEADQDAPWSTLRALLRAGLLKAPGSPGTDPGAYALLSALDAASHVDVAEVATAVVQLLEAVTVDQPVVLVIDDAHYSDGLSLASLQAAIEAMRRKPVLLLVTSLHSWEQAPRSLLRLRGSVGRTLPGRTIHLAPLSERHTRELVASSSSWCQTEADRERLARRVFFETAGNPFLAVTLLRGLAEAASLRKEVLQWPPPGGTIDSPLPISVSSLARSITARIADMTDETRQVLQAACIGPPPIDLALVAGVTGQTGENVQRQLGALERRRFVSFDGERYAITAPLLAEVVRSESLLPGELYTLRTRAIAHLQASDDPESQLLRVQLMAFTAPGPGVFDDALAVARQAMSAGSLRAARTALAVATRNLPAGDDARSRSLDQVRGQVEAPASSSAC
jgi:DNA-binding SARP family transcriptional activator